MAKTKSKTVVCSFCLGDFPYKELYVVEMPMHRLPEGGHVGEYRTPCCNKCVGKEKDRYLKIHSEPKK